MPAALRARRRRRAARRRRLRRRGGEPAREGPRRRRARRDRRGPALPRALPRAPAPLRGERRARHDAGLRLARGPRRALPRAGRGGAPLRVPHIGWNDVRFQRRATRCARGCRAESDLLLRALATARVPRDRARSSRARSTTAATFAAAVAHENVFAVQFHPEKSQARGQAACSTPSRAWVRARMTRGSRSHALAAARGARACVVHDGASQRRPARSCGRSAAVAAPARAECRGGAVREPERRDARGERRRGRGARGALRRARRSRTRGLEVDAPRTTSRRALEPRASRRAARRPAALAALARARVRRDRRRCSATCTRYREREGGALGSMRPASVGFELALLRRAERRAALDRRLRSHASSALSENAARGAALPGRRLALAHGRGARALGRRASRPTALAARRR